MSSMDENFELITLIWLDKSVHTTEENRVIQEKLRSISHSFKSFENTNEFDDFIRKKINLKYDRIILIISGQLGKEIIEKIHHLNEIISIFVFCQNKELNQLWANKYSKVKNVIVELSELLHDIKNETKSDEQLISERMDLFEDKNETIALVSQIKSTIPDRREFLNFCFNYYKNNSEKLLEVQEFEHFYSPAKCFDWFFNRSFLYQLFKRSFQLFHVELIYLLRFFFQDIDQQIDESSNHSQLFFKGQLMTIDQIEFLTNLNENKHFYFHSYLIVNSNEEKTLNLLNSFNHLNGLHKVLFRIESNKLIKNYQNWFLFPLLTSFKKISMKFEKRIWIVDIQVQHQTIFSNQIKQPIDLPNYLKEKHLYDQAEKIFHLLLKQNPLLSSQCYHGIASIHEQKGSYESALNLYLKAVESMSKDHLNYAHYLNHIGSIYDYLKDYQNALNYYFQALKQIKKDKLKLKVLNNIAVTYANLEQYDQAFKYCQDCLDILKKYSYHLDFVYNNLGLICFYLEQYENSFEYFSLALESIQQSNLSKGIVLQNLALLFQKTDQFANSLIYYQQSLDIFKEYQPISHPNIPFIEQQIQSIKQLK